MSLQRSVPAFPITAVSASMCIALLTSPASTYGVGLQSETEALVVIEGQRSALVAMGTKSQEPVGDIVGTLRLPEGSKLTARDLANSVVWLADIELPSERLEEIASSRPHALMDQIDMAFTPFVLPILVGEEVEFRNSDGSVFHGVQSRSPAKTFNLGMYPSGQSKSVVFEKPGVVDIRCMVHSEMLAFVVVAPNPFFAQATSDGSFMIHNVPAGNHTLHMWNHKTGPIDRTISVPPDATATVTIELKGNPNGGAR